MGIIPAGYQRDDDDVDDADEEEEGEWGGASLIPWTNWEKGNWKGKVTRKFRVTRLD